MLCILLPLFFWSEAFAKAFLMEFLLCELLARRNGAFAHNAPYSRSLILAFVRDAVNKLFTIDGAFAQFLRIARKCLRGFQQVAQNGDCAFAHFHKAHSFDICFSPMLLFK